MSKCTYKLAECQQKEMRNSLNQKAPYRVYVTYVCISVIRFQAFTYLHAREKNRCKQYKLFILRTFQKMPHFFEIVMTNETIYKARNEQLSIFFCLAPMHILEQFLLQLCIVILLS